MRLLIALAALGIVASPAAAQDRSNWRDNNQTCSSPDQRDRPECRDRNRSSMDRRDTRHSSNDRTNNWRRDRRYHHTVSYPDRSYSRHHHRHHRYERNRYGDRAHG
jgi:hypothetical protein